MTIEEDCHRRWWELSTGQRCERPYRGVAVDTGTTTEETTTPLVKTDPLMKKTPKYSYPELSSIETLLVERLFDKDRVVRNQAAATLHKRKAIAANETL